ncbi:MULTISPECIES: amino acid ABC transporter permease [Paracoccus]|uniref:Amino acid ABC transporter membrane protein 2, PAAT family n=1 Tax=Paracoccus denitrificans (strain Pd 1222) TaxID=318586 RepID=A1BBU1_PARDP|nr:MULTISPECIES: amino acid ABC transporter permease [Paracoccus]ABL72985.1 amino acid ABC transporter membrane protein 2, PAAT family [Paracoccus denitrificans PD1222]MBB4628362.1 polar amino acid transport system permease protein [Paracoccus denitrificans]MCU7429574.1 amino acid ABC transporter permease [Paracoccus denitrificans]MDK8873737.1 amino acid ABC transporter permease [Paracoccus sp. SSJ]QAR29381.1 amino acid ABC transporter permease [Paracoccus denitrificans]
MLTTFQMQALLTAAVWTAGLSLIAFVLGGAVGLLIAVMRVSANRVLRGIAFTYIQIVQGTPLLVMMMLAFFGLSILGFDLTPFAAASFAMVIYSSAYFGEIWRGGILAVPKTQWEAAECLALHPVQRFWLVIIPQGLRISTPPTVGFMVQIVKNTSLASVIGVAELTYTSKLINNSTFQPFIIFSVVAVLYFCMCYPLAWWSRKLEDKLNVAHR